MAFERQLFIGPHFMPNKRHPKIMDFQKAKSLVFWVDETLPNHPTSDILTLKK